MGLSFTLPFARHCGKFHFLPSGNLKDHAGETNPTGRVHKPFSSPGLEAAPGMTRTEHMLPLQCVLEKVT